LFGELCPQKPSPFGAGIGISSLNVESNNLSTAQPIPVIRSSNDTASRKKFGHRGHEAKICFSGELLMNNFPKGVSQPKYSIAQLFKNTTDSYKQ
jgi:hypothetical protein